MPWLCFEKGSESEGARAGERKHECVGTDGDSRELRGEQQIDDAVGSAQIGEQAEHACGKRHEAERPSAREELVGQGKSLADAPPSTDGRCFGGAITETLLCVDAFESPHDGERSGACSAEKEIACYEHIEHAAPVFRSPGEKLSAAGSRKPAALLPLSQCS